MWVSVLVVHCVPPQKFSPHSVRTILVGPLLRFSDVATVVNVCNQGWRNFFRWLTYSYRATNSLYYFASEVFRKINKTTDSEEIRTLASEEIGALNQRLRPLGHTTSTDE